LAAPWAAKATGRGAFVTGREAGRRIGLDLNGGRVAVQGMGNVGSSAAELFVQASAEERGLCPWSSDTPGSRGWTSQS